MGIFFLLKYSGYLIHQLLWMRGFAIFAIYIALQPHLLVDIFFGLTCVFYVILFGPIQMLWVLRAKYRKNHKPLSDSMFWELFFLFSSWTKTTQTTVLSGHHSITNLFKSVNNKQQETKQITSNRKQSNQSVFMFSSSSCLILAPTQQTFVHFIS